jgi:hypothetical protein
MVHWGDIYLNIRKQNSYHWDRVGSEKRWNEYAWYGIVYKCDTKGIDHSDDGNERTWKGDHSYTYRIPLFTHKYETITWLNWYGTWRSGIAWHMLWYIHTRVGVGIVMWCLLYGMYWWCTHYYIMQINVPKRHTTGCMIGMKWVTTRCHMSMHDMV